VNAKIILQCYILFAPFSLKSPEWMPYFLIRCWRDCLSMHAFFAAIETLPSESFNNRVIYCTLNFSRTLLLASLYSRLQITDTASSGQITLRDSQLKSSGLMVSPFENITALLISFWSSLTLPDHFLETRIFNASSENLF